MVKKYEYQPSTVREALFTVLVGELRDMVKLLQNHLQDVQGNSGCKRIGSSPVSHRKPDVVDWIQSVVLDPDLAQRVYSEMDLLEQHALSEIVHEPLGELYPAKISAKYGKYPSLHEPRRGDFLEAHSLADKRVFCPLLSIVMARNYQLARDAQEVYRSFVPEPPEPAPQYLSTLPERLTFPSGEATEEFSVHSMEQRALLDVQTMLNLVAQSKVGVSTKTGRVSKAGARTIREALSQGDYYGPEAEGLDPYDVQMGTAGIIPFAWPLLLQAGKLAQPEGGKLALTRSGRAALKKKPHQVLKTLWERWLKTTMLHEMNRIEVIKGQKSKKHPLYAARKGRECLDEGLIDLEPGQWILVSDFFRHLFARGDAVDVVRNAWALYIGDPEHGSFGFAHIHWDHLNGRFARAFLLEYAATLGIIDVALVPPWGAVTDLRGLWGTDGLTCLSRYDGLMALRLTPLGAWILGKTTEYTPAKPASFLSITPELTVKIVDPQQAAQAGSMLERFCIQEDASTFRLDAGKAMQAVEQGMSPSEMRDFLRQGSSGELPEQVRSFLEQVEQRCSIFRIAGEASLVQCSDPGVLRDVLNDPEIRKLCLPAGEYGLVVRKADEEAFRVCLHKLGYALPLG